MMKIACDFPSGKLSPTDSFIQGVQRFGAKATWPQRVSKLRKICEALWNKPRFQASKFLKSDGKLANDSKFFTELGEAMSWNQIFQGPLARKPCDLYLNHLDHTVWNDKVIPFAVSLLNSRLDSITLDFCRRLNGKVEQNRVQKKSHLRWCRDRHIFVIPNTGWVAEWSEFFPQRLPNNMHIVSKTSWSEIIIKPQQ